MRFDDLPPDAEVWTPLSYRRLDRLAIRRQRIERALWRRGVTAGELLRGFEWLRGASVRLWVLNGPRDPLSARAPWSVRCRDARTLLGPGVTPAEVSRAALAVLRLYLRTLPAVAR